jgi:hypothetical protein
LGERELKGRTPFCVGSRPLAAAMRPIIRRPMDSPMPVPCGLVVKNASKMRSGSSPGSPIPESLTAISNSPSLVLFDVTPDEALEREIAARESDQLWLGRLGPGSRGGPSRTHASSQRINSTRRQRCRRSPASSFSFASFASMFSSIHGSATASGSRGRVR